MTKVVFINEAKIAFELPFTETDHHSLQRKYVEENLKHLLQFDLDYTTTESAKRWGYTIVYLK